MKLTYLNNNSWLDITREERYYCSELFFHFREDPLKLINLLFKTKTINCLDKKDLKSKWEIGYEVCFYRDLIHHLNKTRDNKIKIDNYNRKRTFDLCLFSENKILIIEAKVQSGFDSKQMKHFKKDEKHFNNLGIKEGIKFPEIHLVGLAADTYFINVEKPGRKGIPELIKENYLTWSDIYNGTEKIKIFQKANQLYNN